MSRQWPPASNMAWFGRRPTPPLNFAKYASQSRSAYFDLAPPAAPKVPFVPLVPFMAKEPLTMPAPPTSPGTTKPPGDGEPGITACGDGAKDGLGAGPSATKAALACRRLPVLVCRSAMGAGPGAIGMDALGAGAGADGGAPSGAGAGAGAFQHRGDRRGAGDGVSHRPHRSRWLRRHARATAQVRHATDLHEQRGRQDPAGTDPQRLPNLSAAPSDEHVERLPRHGHADGTVEGLEGLKGVEPVQPLRQDPQGEDPEV
mmetsp:Transcript_35425/g.102027  ORF Transcript_35425/g.102027 Transcript_35425/m.102027 type:complete len:259 (-) Transcript_35425:1471-2247(-)